MESFFQILDTACWLFSSKFKLCFYITNLAWLCLAQSQLYHVLIFLHQSCIMPNSKFPPTAFKIIFNLFPLSVPFWFITCSNFVSMALKEFQKLCKIFRSVLFSSLLVICVVFLCIYIFDETLSRFFCACALLMFIMWYGNTVDASRYSVHVHKFCLVWRLSFPCCYCCCRRAVCSPRGCTNLAEFQRVSRGIKCIQNDLHEYL